MTQAKGRFSRLSWMFSLFRSKSFDAVTESERSKERLRRAALTTAGSSAAKAVSLLSQLVSVPLTYRYLGAERYGIWMVLISIIGAMSFADLGIGNGLVNAISEAYGKDDQVRAKEHISSALALMLAIAVFLSITGTAAYPFLPWLRLLNVKSAVAATEGAQAFLVLYASFVINIPLGVITRTQLGIQKGYISQAVNAIGGIASLCLILLVIHFSGSLAWLVFASVGTGIVATIINGWILFREHPWLLPSLRAFRSNSAKNIFRMGILFFVLQFSFTLGFTSDNIVIAQILGAAAVAAYSVPQKLFVSVAGIVNMAVGPFWPAFGEAIARGDVRWVRRVFWGSFWLALAVSVPLCALLVVAGPWILRVAIGKPFHAPVSLMIALAVWGVVGSIAGVSSILLNGAGVLRQQVVLAVVTSLCNLSISILLTKSFGIIGVCLGSILTQVFITLPAYGFLIRKLFKKLAMMESWSTAKDITPQLESIQG